MLVRCWTFFLCFLKYLILYIYLSIYLDTVYTHQQVDHPFSGVRSNGGESRRRMSHADATVDHDGPWGLLNATFFFANFTGGDGKEVVKFFFLDFFY